MWIKVTSLEQLAALQIGSPIAIHPLQGPPRDTFDESDADQVSHRLVSANDAQSKVLTTISLQRKEEARTVTSASMGSMMLGSGEMSYADAIEHGTWWIPSGI